MGTNLHLKEINAHDIPVTKDMIPNIVYGRLGAIRVNIAISGDAIPPTRAHALHMPVAALLHVAYRENKPK